MDTTALNIFGWNPFNAEWTRHQDTDWLAVGRNVTFTFDFDIDLTLDWTILFLKAIYTGTCPFR
jgi:hypothetical protein